MGKNQNFCSLQSLQLIAYFIPSLNQVTNFQHPQELFLFNIGNEGFRKKHISLQSTRKMEVTELWDMVNGQLGNK